MRLATLSLFLCCVSIAHGQSASVKVSYPAMAIHRLSAGLWQCDEITADVHIEWPDKTTSRMRAIRSSDGDASIPATLVDGIFIRRVRECYLRGTLPDAEIVAYLEPEPVRIKRFRVTAIGIHCPVTVTRWDGETWRGSIWQPDCVADWRGVGLRVARPVTCLGTITKGPS